MDETLSTQEYADSQGVSRRTVQRWIQQSLIFAVKVGREYRIPFDEQPPTFFQKQDLANSNVEPFPSTINPNSAGFPETQQDSSISGLPTERDNARFRPETPDVTEEEEEEGEEECKDASDFETKDLRKVFSSKDEAESYADDIPVPTEVFRRCSDDFYQVAITY